jgi:hypothetical protein
VTAWGAKPARGRLHYCGTCGATIAFGEERRPGRIAEPEADRVTAAVEAHFEKSPLCRKGETFTGIAVVACRCDRPVALAREDGLSCARCEGSVAPILASPGSRRKRRRGTG